MARANLRGGDGMQRWPGRKLLPKNRALIANLRGNEGMNSSSEATQYRSRNVGCAGVFHVKTPKGSRCGSKQTQKIT
jgi:hypothetical protein